MEQQYILKPYKKSSDFAKSPLRYAGGKFYALKQILPYLYCIEHNEYREPFLGGGSVFFGKKLCQYNWINDLDTHLINVYRAFADKKTCLQLIKMLEHEEATKERHSEMKDLIPKNVIEEVYKTFYLNRTSYCGIINNPAWGYSEGKSSPPKNWGNFILDVQPKLARAKITNEDFSKVITTPAEKGHNVLLYLDPPYFLADQKRAYTKSFQLSDHLKLCELLKHTTFPFCLSYDNVPEVRDLYSWANIYELEWLYNTANIKGKTRQLGRELIITNYRITKINNQIEIPFV